jgi:SM-20-related protein
MTALDLQRFAQTPLECKPFDYLVIPNFIRPDALRGINADYPAISRPGSFPISEVQPGPAFQSFVDELNGSAFRDVVERKFGIDLRGKATITTVRGQCGKRDGRIHTDSATKIITVLLYMNPAWEVAGGRLRLLRSAKNLDDVVVEVPPIEGTLLAFRRSNNSWHGHKPFVGLRRVVQFNWITTQEAAQRHLSRHCFTAWIKNLRSRFARPQPALQPKPL